MNNAHREQQARNLAKILFDLARSEGGLARVYSYLLQTGTLLEPEQESAASSQSQSHLSYHFPTILDIIDAGLVGDPSRVRAYTRLLLERIESDPAVGKEEGCRLMGYLQQALATDGQHQQEILSSLANGE